MSNEIPPLLVWFRRDFRLGDHAALAAAVRTGHPIIPIFIYDREVETLGGAAKWRLEQAIAQFERRLLGLGSRLILRRGEAWATLKHLIAQSGAQGVYWSRAYDPASITRDRAIKARLKAAGKIAISHTGHLLCEPWQIQTKNGTGFKVFTPYWRTLSQQFECPPPTLTPRALPAPKEWPASETLQDWQLGKALKRVAPIMAHHALIGEQAALARLNSFLHNSVNDYATARDMPAIDGCSRLSEPLSLGEISPRQIYATALDFQTRTQRDVSAFLRQLFWREFAYHLLWHFPTLDRDCWRVEWQNFDWHTNAPPLQAWQWGRTGVDFVDAGMRELYASGRMHNRLRMIVGSYLCKHLLLDWRLGLAWFAQTLTDWDPANNAMGWQWIAGCGPDASPYFRVFNPELQAEKFDPDGHYRRHWLSGEGADEFYAALPKAQQSACQNRPTTPTTPLAEGRARALAAYRAFNKRG